MKVSFYELLSADADEKVLLHKFMPEGILCIRSSVFTLTGLILSFFQSILPKSWDSV
jgi:hypothetical protein